MKKVMTMLMIAIVLVGCKPEPTVPEPSELPVVIAPQPKPSWVLGMEPGCFVTNEPVAYECLEGGAPRCEHMTSTGPCWWIDPANNDVWYRE